MRQVTGLRRRCRIQKPSTVLENVTALVGMVESLKPLPSLRLVTEIVSFLGTLLIVGLALISGAVTLRRTFNIKESSIPKTVQPHLSYPTGDLNPIFGPNR